MRFSKAYNTKNICGKKCVANLCNAFTMDILCGTFSIPGELLLSRARFRLLNGHAKLFAHLYIYNLS